MLFVFGISSIKASDREKKIAFIENKGQVFDEKMRTNSEVLFSGTDGVLVYHLKRYGISYQINQIVKDNISEDGSTKERIACNRVDIKWINTNQDFEIKKDKSLDGINNYYLQSCPNGIFGVKSYEDVVYKNLYNGIDIHFYGKNGKLKYDYIVSRNSDFKQIKFQVLGANKISIDNNGSLVIESNLGNITEAAPLVIQQGKELKSKWRVNNNIVSFEIENINRNLPYTIDPEVRSWGTYLGGVGDDYSFSTSVNNKGDVFITGSTSSINYLNICTSGSYQTNLSNYTDGFISKYNSSGQRIWSTYYGGLGHDKANSCSASSNGGVFICGETDTVSNVLASVGCHQYNYGGGLTDAFIARFDSSGIRIWGTFYGGSLEDGGTSCKVDQYDNLIVVGSSVSNNNISTIGAYRFLLNGGFDAYLVKFDSSGQRKWATYYGGDAYEDANCCSVDTDGNIIIAGTSTSTNGYIAMGAGLGFITSNTTPGTTNAYLGKFDQNGNFLWATFYGAIYIGFCSSICRGLSCTFDLSGNIYLTGATNMNTPLSSGIYITTPGCYQSVKSGSDYSLDGFIVKFNSSGQREWATFYGNPAQDFLLDCTTDKDGNLYVAGSSGPWNNIWSSKTYQNSGNGYFVKFDSTGKFLFESNLGYNNIYNIRSIACSSIGGFFTSGFAGNPSLNTLNVATPNAAQYYFGGGVCDAFLVKYDICPRDLNISAPFYLMCKGVTNTLTASGSPTYTWSTGSNSPSIIVSPSVTSIYTVSTISGTCNLSLAIEITISDPTITAISNQSVICTGETATLSANGASLYYWNSINASVSGSVIVVSPSVTTTYSIFAYGEYGCTATSFYTQNVASCVGVNEFNVKDEFYKIFPNPANNEITLECQTQFLKNVKMEIYNLTGICVYKSEITDSSTKIVLNDIESGVYFVMIKEGSNILDKIKLIKL